MKAVQKFSHAHLALCSPVRLFHSPQLGCLGHLCCDRLGPKADIVEQSTCQWSRTASQWPKRSLINRVESGDRFSVIVNTLKLTSCTLTTRQQWEFSPCFDVIRTHLIGPTNATLGFDPIALSKMSLKCNKWPKYNRNLHNRNWPHHLYPAWKL